MLVLKREESDGEYTRLARDQKVLPLTQALTKGGEYEREQRLEIAVEHDFTDDVPLAEWTPETGWKVTTFADDEALLQAHLDVHEVSERLYVGTDSFEPVGMDLAYLFAALAKGASDEWYEPEGPQDGPDRYTNVVKLCRGIFPEGHRLWQHVTIVPQG